MKVTKGNFTAEYGKSGDYMKKKIRYTEFINPVIFSLLACQHAFNSNFVGCIVSLVIVFVNIKWAQ